MTTPTVNVKMEDYKKVRKLMQLATSDNDAEALAALRKANAIWASYGIDWERVFARVVTVVNEFEPAPPGQFDDASSQGRRFDPEGDKKKADIEEAFRLLADEKLSRGFGGFIDSLRTQWEDKGKLTTGQFDALMKAAQVAREGSIRR